MSSSVLPVFLEEFYSFWSYIQALIHFEFIFVYGVRKCSNLVLSHVAIQFSQHFIEETVFAPLYILASFVKNKVPIGAWVYFWAFYLFHWSVFLFLCQYHTVLMSTALWYNLKSGRLIPPAPFLFIKSALAIWDLLCFHMNCEIFLFQFCERCHW